MESAEDWLQSHPEYVAAASGNVAWPSYNSAFGDGFYPVIGCGQKDVAPDYISATVPKYDRPRRKSKDGS